MSIKDVVRLSLLSMLKNKMRTALTVLGMVVGISSIIIVFSAGEGIRSLIVGQIESFGTNLIEVEVKVPVSKAGMEGEAQSVSSMASGFQITTLKEDDLEDIKKLNNISGAYGSVTNQASITYSNKTKQSLIMGVGSNYIDIDKSEIDKGYFFTDDENNSLSQVVVLGPKIAEELFGDINPIEKYVRIKRGRYKVIGVLKEKGATMGFDFDNLILMPVKTLQKKMMGIDYYSYFIFQTVDTLEAEETAELMRDILRDNHNIDNPVEDDFRVTTMKEMMDASKTVTNALTILLLLIVAISLVVGGVGILNVMYVIVSERTPEIGLRKAVGANFSDIMRQFLIESVLITLVGGIVGIFLGILFSFFIYLGANYFGLDWEFILPIKSFIVAILFALIFGVLFGLLPARKAGKLDPVEALRKD